MKVSGRSSPWSRPETVRGFVESPPNQTLLEVAAGERGQHPARARALDIGCGAGRNAWPLSELGWAVCGIDASRPMLTAAAARARSQTAPVHLVQAAMHELPFADCSFDFVVAHGVWNLATNDAELRTAMREAARVATPGAALFVFTFSRHTLSPHATPLAGETYTYDQFSGDPQIFLTDEQLVAELAKVGFLPDPAVPLREHNRPATPLLASGGPVIYEGTFRLRHSD
jgi:ubiquinone/menaquinone biosynthesis C-methylase UbiE